MMRFIYVVMSGVLIACLVIVPGCQLAVALPAAGAGFGAVIGAGFRHETGTHVVGGALVGAIAGVIVDAILIGIATAYPGDDGL
jgi:hypothetical protein